MLQRNQSATSSSSSSRFDSQVPISSGRKRPVQVTQNEGLENMWVNVFRNGLSQHFNIAPPPPAYTGDKIIEVALQYLDRKIYIINNYNGNDSPPASDRYLNYFDNGDVLFSHI